MTDQQFADLIRRALPAYEKKMYERTMPAFMCHVLEDMHDNQEIDVFTLKNAQKRIYARINNKTTLFAHLNATQGPEPSLAIGAEKHRAIRFWHEWIEELDEGEM